MSQWEIGKLPEIVERRVSCVLLRVSSCRWEKSTMCKNVLRAKRAERQQERITRPTISAFAIMIALQLRMLMAILSSGTRPHATMRCRGPRGPGRIVLSISEQQPEQRTPRMSERIVSCLRCESRSTNETVESKSVGPFVRDYSTCLNPMLPGRPNTMTATHFFGRRRAGVTWNVVISTVHDIELVG